MIGKGCVSSDNYPRDYESNQGCTITAPLGSTIEVIAFATESVSYDWLIVNDKKYGGTSGTSGPNNVVLTSPQIKWR